MKLCDITLDRFMHRALTMVTEQPLCRQTGKSGEELSFVLCIYLHRREQSSFLSLSFSTAGDCSGLASSAPLDR